MTFNTTAAISGVTLTPHTRKEGCWVVLGGWVLLQGDVRTVGTMTVTWDPAYHT